MILIDQLPKSRKITAYLDADIKQVVQEFFLKNYLAEENIETKQQLLRDTKESIVKYVSPIIDLSEFPFMYPVNGITDGLNTLAVECRNKTIKTFDGEYDWLQLNLPKNVNYNTGDVLYVSNPSSIDGNYISNWNEIINTHQDIALDCAYIGSCRIEKIEINENQYGSQITISFKNQLDYYIKNCDINNIRNKKINRIFQSEEEVEIILPNEWLKPAAVSL